MHISYFIKDGDGYVQIVSCETNRAFLKGIGAFANLDDLLTPKPVNVKVEAEQTPEPKAVEKVEAKPASRRRPVTE
jgi:hypothetical protein